MSFVTFLAVYFVLWWLCLFMVLPFGVRNQVDDGKVIHGTDPGAPIVLRLWRRLLATSLLAGVLYFVVTWMLSAEWLQRYWS